jgi:hypothetical protein
MDTVVTAAVTEASQPTAGSARRSLINFRKSLQALHDELLHVEVPLEERPVSSSLWFMRSFLTSTSLIVYESAVYP